MKILESYYKRNTETSHICSKNKSNCDKINKVDIDLAKFSSNPGLRTPIQNMILTFEINFDGLTFKEVHTNLEIINFH